MLDKGLYFITFLKFFIESSLISSNILAINDTDKSTNGVQNFNVDLDIRGDSNDVWLNHNGNADNHHLYVYVYGDSNDVEYNMVNGGTGKNTTANAAVGHYNSPDHGMVGDPDLVSIDFWIIGSNNRVHGATHGDNNYMLVEVMGSGQSNILDVHPNANGYVRMVQLGDNEKAYLRVSGSNNTFVGVQNAPEYLKSFLSPKSVLQLYKNYKTFRYIKGEGTAKILAPIIKSYPKDLKLKNPNESNSQG